MIAQPNSSFLTILFCQPIYGKMIMRKNGSAKYDAITASNLKAIKKEFIYRKIFFNSILLILLNKKMKRHKPLINNKLQKYIIKMRKYEGIKEL